MKKSPFAYLVYLSLNLNIFSKMEKSEYALIILPKFKIFRQKDISTAKIIIFQDFAISQVEIKPTWFKKQLHSD